VTPEGTGAEWIYDGDYRTIAPAIGAELFDVVTLIPNELACYVDDEGLLKNRPINVVASILYAEERGADSPIVGPAIFFRPTPDGDMDELREVGLRALAAARIAMQLATDDIARRN
jgi:hypothetical protein